MRVFDHEIDGAGGDGKRYYGERVGVVRCIFGVSGRVGGGGIREERGK